eukprot:g31460.t1
MPSTEHNPKLSNTQENHSSRPKNATNKHRSVTSNLDKGEESAFPSPGGEPDCFSFFNFLWAGSPSLLSLIRDHLVSITTYSG